MMEIRPSALYSRADLAEMLKPLGIDVDGWLAKIRPARRFRLAYFGEDLLDAIRKTPTLDAGEREAADLPAALNKGNRARRGGRIGDPLGPLKLLMRRDDDRLPR